MLDEPRDAGSNPADRQSTERQLSRRSLWFVGVLGLSALVLGGIQLQRTVKDPFSLFKSQAGTTQKPEEVALLELQAKDTDSDGITDYDELYSFNTSPYIADSDSDSVSDKDEVNRGTDPNCPEGKTCGGLPTTNTAGNVNVPDGSGSTGNESVTNTSAATTNATATQLREALIAAGVSKTELDTVDDATLLESYQSVLAEEAATNANATNTAPATQLQTLTASEIRELLVANGVDANTLAAYSDATLVAVYEQALKESNSSSNANTNGS